MSEMQTCGLISLPKLARVLDINERSLRRRIEDGVLRPDFELDLGALRPPLLVFRPERVEEIRTLLAATRRAH